MRCGVECFVDGKRLFGLEADSMEPDLAREIAIELAEAHLERKVLGGDHGMNAKVTRIVVSALPAPVVRPRRGRGKGL